MVFSSWGCDICAYLAGMVLGKHHLFPRLSPKKTVEGCLGGIIGAGIFALIYGLVVHRYITDMNHEWIIFPIVCMLGAVVGMCGDLVASAIKRKTGIKDFGKLIPGHGGVLDRYDSMLLVAPIIYLVDIYMNVFQ